MVVLLFFHGHSDVMQPLESKTTNITSISKTIISGFNIS